MAVNLIGEDIKLMRKRYDEALTQQGIPVTYQFPLKPQPNAQGETVVDSYSDMIPTHIFFEGNPKVKTFKRYGWVVENDANLPFLIHCSFNLQHMQKDCIFRMSGQYSPLKSEPTGPSVGSAVRRTSIPLTDSSSHFRARANVVFPDPSIPSRTTNSPFSDIRSCVSAFSL